MKGLTTAAAIWIVAALGLACGAGLVVEAITATLLALFVLIALRWAERALLTTSKPHAHRLQIEATAAAALLEEVTAVCSRLGIDLKRIEARTDRAEMRVEIVCQASTDTLLAQALSQIQALPGVQAVQADLDVLPRSREAEQ